MCGACIAIGLASALIVYMVFTCLRFGDARPSIYVERLPMNMSAIATPTFGVLYRKNYATVDRPDMMAIDVQVYTIRNQDALPRTSVPAEDVPCPPDILEFDESTSCFKGTMEGSYELPKYQYVRVGIALCKNSTENNNTCAPHQDQLDFVLNGGRVNLLVSYQDVAGQILFTRHWKLTRALYTSLDVFFTKKVVQEPNRYSPFSNTSAMYTYPDGFDLQIDDRDLTRTSIFTVYLRLDRFMSVEVWSRQTLLDLVGSWGALWSSLTLVFGIFARRYNIVMFNRQLQKHLEPGTTLRELYKESFGRHGRLRKHDAIKQVKVNRSLVRQQSGLGGGLELPTVGTTRPGAEGPHPPSVRRSSLIPYASVRDLLKAASPGPPPAATGGLATVTNPLQAQAALQQLASKRSPSRASEDPERPAGASSPSPSLASSRRRARVNRMIALRSDSSSSVSNCL